MASDQTDQTISTKVITIDGPAGAGKSTVAKKLAKILHYSYLDTGAMYRALTYKAVQERVDLNDEGSLAALAESTMIELEDLPEGVRVLLDGIDVSEQIRTVEVTNNTSLVSQKPRVREIMVGWQRTIAEKKNVVIEGRDTGTVVFPNATYKFYLESDLAERVRRRAKELKESGHIIEEEKLTHEVNERDNMDKNRSVGPLKKADDAHLIDTTHLSADETVTQILQIIN